MLWKGEAEEKETPCSLPSTPMGHFPLGSFSYTSLQNSLSSKFSEILWDSASVASPGWCMPAINHSLASQPWNVQCAGRLEGPHRREVFTSQVTKCEFLSNIRTSPPPTPLLAGSVERKKKKITKYLLWKRHKAYWERSVCSSALHISATLRWFLASIFQDFGHCGRSMSPDMVDHLHLQNRIKKWRDTQQLIIKETFPFLTLKRSQISWIPRPPRTIQIP